MTTLHAARALLPTGWATDVRLRLDGLRIAEVTPGTPPAPGDHRLDALLPALSNLHCHSFQRAMAGRTERRAAGRDTFWTWRETMYRFVERLTPAQITAIAALTFAEMQESGFAAVAEFHYLHNQPDGTPYDDPAELSQAILAAAAETGIGLTLLPVFYRWGGADRRPLKGGQRRFSTPPDHFAAILDRARAAARALPADTRTGIAPHSLRAAAPDDLQTILPLAQGGPIHIHAAEQTAEVEEIFAHLGARPVEWLLANAPLGPDWCLIHCTHLTPAETAALAASGATAGLCPLTEANLGDGIFDAPPFLAAGGAFGVGSDSCIRISAPEELRALEYSQRLRDRARNVLAREDGHTGARLWTAAATGGARALARPAGAIAAGHLADLVALDGRHPALAGLAGDALLDGFVFAAGDGTVTDLWSAGRHMVRDGRHVARDRLRAAYARAIAALDA